MHEKWSLFLSPPTCIRPNESHDAVIGIVVIVALFPLLKISHGFCKKKKSDECRFNPGACSQTDLANTH